MMLSQSNQNQKANLKIGIHSPVVLTLAGLFYTCGIHCVDARS
ncbi:hypothetical protein VAE151_500070 [Vibrio aestuarianus]|nr:hypothetical protein VIBAE_A10070 [Vibrio aestuarianus subsp. francensis]CAH8182617.1 hypothetical protein VAE032_220070 [Vibrio aestuarianus]CAH8182700.1 hypothetical protein VAE055_320070 [Vibrio aestuarianus]CAH8182783.1 hypothetical protein VAE128_420070 [Vibrio aestuarianus]CAH8182856.1 hypothetical protein VAE130_530070 [Vibrio aestuarianus]